MLLWFADLMNVTEEVTIHRPNVSTLLSLTESYSQPPPREHPKLILGGRWGFPSEQGF